MEREVEVERIRKMIAISESFNEDVRLKINAMVIENGTKNGEEIAKESRNSINEASETSLRAIQFKKNSFWLNDDQSSSIPRGRGEASLR